tara:strand:- start:46927 stop:47325 length:399 start_codon:yes stop_codon:yes gene_type:complete
MAVITTKLTVSGNDTRNYAASAAATLASADSVLLTGLDPSFMHNFLGVKMYDVSGDEIVDSAGTFTVSYLSEVSGDPNGDETGTFESPPVSTIDATAPTSLCWKAPTVGIRVSAASLSDTVTWKVFFVSSKH